MEIVSLNNNATFKDILLGIPTGKVKRYILTEENIERLSSIIRFAYKLEKSNKKVYIEVKFDSQYTPRPKRLEIVAKWKDCIEIYKFSNKSSFEKECLEVQRTIDEIVPKTNLSVKGFIVIPNFMGELKPFMDRVSEITTDITIIPE